MGVGGESQLRPTGEQEDLWYARQSALAGPTATALVATAAARVRSTHDDDASQTVDVKDGRLPDVIQPATCREPDPWPHPGRSLSLRSPRWNPTNGSNATRTTSRQGPGPLGPAVRRPARSRLTRRTHGAGVAPHPAGRDTSAAGQPGVCAFRCVKAGVGPSSPLTPSPDVPRAEPRPLRPRPDAVRPHALNRRARGPVRLPGCGNAQRKATPHNSRSRMSCVSGRTTDSAKEDLP
ncbi:hypothetical protein M2163_000232 [Streptomyces sp. SAI-135]|jgi:hypothetical protein|nr:hypothetical protein [Streptomyces sp. SAI-090]MDH6574146.1 hypothetical protein [Streptomyces sp. SAI-117]MDH6581117.1 hypothetical protein [Streptomyces sp. SAI-133]MDH6613124.1 hypothetical protein [Streptomyces sp. SAI-135]